MKIDSIQRKLDAQLTKYFKSEGYSNKEIKDLGLYKLEFEKNTQGNYVDVYIYAEITADEFFSISNSLDDIVTSFDSSAYFDIISPGIYMARIYTDSNITSYRIHPEYELNSNDLTKFGEVLSISLEDEFGEEFWVDDIYYQKASKILYAEFSSQSYQTQSHIKIHIEDISDYQDLLNVYQDKFVESLINQTVEI